VFGWKCPSDVEIQRIYVKSGEQAVISFQTQIKLSHNNILSYYVAKSNLYNVFTATFFDNILKNEKSYMGSEFIGDSNTGNFTVKTASVKKQDGGTYMLLYKEGTADINTEQCAMLYILGICIILQTICSSKG
jgi:hypothetical protein